MSNEESERDRLWLLIEQMFEEGVAAGYFERLDRRGTLDDAKANEITYRVGDAVRKGGRCWRR